MGKTGIDALRALVARKVIAVKSSSVARTALLSAFTDGMAAIAGLLFVIVSTSLLYRYLGPAKFGVWATVSSLNAALAFMDFGLGNAAIGALARAARLGSKTLIRTVVIALLAAASGVGLILLTILLTALQLGDANALLSPSAGQGVHELNSFLATYSVLLAVNFVSNAMGQAARGFQKAWVFNCSRLLGFLGAAVGIWLGRNIEADLSELLLLSFGVQLMLNLTICGGMLAFQTHGSGRIRAARVVLFARRMMTSGSSFVLFNIARTFGWLLDYLIVARLMGPEAAAALAIIQRMFQVVQIGYSILSGALWPAYAYLISGQEWRQLKQVFTVGFSATVIYAILASVAIFNLRETIATIWLQTSVLALTTTYALYAMWNCVEAAGSSFSVLLNAKGVVTRQAAAALVFAAVSFCLKLWIVPLYGLTGLVGSTLAGYAVGFCVLLLLIRNVSVFSGRF